MNPRKIRVWAGRALLSAVLAAGLFAAALGAVTPAGSTVADPEWNGYAGSQPTTQLDPEWN